MINVKFLNLDNPNQKAAFVSVLSNASLIVLKVITGFLTGSFSIISEAIHSTGDILASFIAFFAVKKASEPADKEHAFGHGKYEDFSGLIEGFLIICAAAYISYESIFKIIKGVHSEINVDGAIYVMIFSIFVNIFVSGFLYKTSKKTGSVAIFADAEHLRTDVLTSVGILIGLAIIKFTGNYIIDPFIALCVSVLIFESGLKICKKTTSNLLDTSLPIELEKQIIDLVEHVKSDKIFKVCKLKTRCSGVRKNIEITVCVDGNMTVNESHEFCNTAEKILAEKIGNTDTIIHIEPACNKCRREEKVVI